MTDDQFTNPRVHFLLVEDEQLVAIAYLRALAAYGQVSTATSVTDACFLVAEVSFTGIVTDVSLPDGTGFEIALEARKRASEVPILIVSGGDVEPRRLELAHQLNASYLMKPVDVGQLGLFAQRAILRQRRTASLLAAWTERFDLSAAEAVTMKLALDGLKREEIAIVRRVSPSTVKNQIGSLLAKLGVTTMPEARIRFYEELALPR